MSERQWRDLFKVRTAFHFETQPDTPAQSFKAMRKSLSALPTRRDFVTCWLLYDETANCVGLCPLQHPKPESPDYDGNKDRVYAEPIVLKPYRRQGVGTQLLPLVVNYAQSVGATWLQWDTKLESGFRFSEKLGATEAGRQRTNRLNAEQIDWDLMQRWADEGQARNPETKLLRFVNRPDPDLIDPFCGLVTAVNRLQPRDKLEGIEYTLTAEEFEKQVQHLEEGKSKYVVICTRETNDELSGMTDLIYSEARPSHAKVRLTGVRREQQGRGLGKWLKAAMMLDMGERYSKVEFVETDNFNTNRPMLSINDRMGFKLHEQYIFYKMRVSDVAAKINKPHARSFSKSHTMDSVNH